MNKIKLDFITKMFEWDDQLGRPILFLPFSAKMFAYIKNNAEI